MDLYGGACACCGETMLAFLTIDHVHHDGTSKRKAKIHGGGGSFYKKLRKLPRDNSLQVLCWNCNLGRRVTGVCPHKNNTYVERALGRGKYERQQPSIGLLLPRVRQTG